MAFKWECFSVPEFAICGFDYSRFRFNNLNLLSAGFSLDYSRIFVLVASNMCLFVENSVPLLSAVLVFAGISKNVTPANIEGRLYSSPLFRLAALKYTPLWYRPIEVLSKELFGNNLRIWLREDWSLDSKHINLHNIRSTVDKNVGLLGNSEKKLYLYLITSVGRANQ